MKIKLLITGTVRWFYTNKSFFHPNIKPLKSKQTSRIFSNKLRNVFSVELVPYKEAKSPALPVHEHTFPSAVYLCYRFPSKSVTSLMRDFAQRFSVRKTRRRSRNHILLFLPGVKTLSYFSKRKKEKKDP